MQFVLATDKNLVGQTGICIRSIALAHQGRSDISVAVLLGDVSKRAKASLLRFTDKLPLKVHAIDVDAKELQDIASTLPVGHLTFGTLLRLQMGSLLPEDWHRVIYLDVDLLVLRDLDGIFNLELGGRVVGARRDNNGGHMREFGISPDTYFNAGVMVVDLDAWRRENVGEKALMVLREKAEHLHAWDQCALNIALRGETTPISESYNSWLFGYNVAAGEPIPHIIHWAGTTKPWPNACIAPWGELYYRMSADTPWPVEYKPYKRKLGERIMGRVRMLIDSGR